jgi:hypothetical protein
MGTTLTGTTPQDTYDSLIKVTDNGPISGTLKALSDGLGNDSTLSLSTTAASIAGTLAVAGDFSIADKIVHIGDTNTAIRFPAADTITFETSGLEAARITSAGDVRFGDGNNFNPLIQYAGSGRVAASPAYSFFGDLDTGMFNPNTGNTIAFSTAATERLRIDASGNVGIGTSSPSYKLTVGNPTADASQSQTYAGNNDQIGVNASYVPSGTFPRFFDIVASGAADGTNGESNIRFFTNGVTSTTKTEKLRILANGGITFNGDTAAANALDDYEEGTWTIGVSFGLASVGVTTSFNTGTYTKIGRQVTVNGRLTLTSKGSSTGAARITGLPFTIPNSAAYYSAPSLLFVNISFVNQYSGIAEIGSTRIEFYETTILGVLSAITDADFANNSEVILSMTYFV